MQNADPKMWPNGHPKLQIKMKIIGKLTPSMHNVHLSKEHAIN